MGAAIRPPRTPGPPVPDGSKYVVQQRRGLYRPGAPACVLFVMLFSTLVVYMASRYRRTHAAFSPEPPQLPPIIVDAQATQRQQSKASTGVGKETLSDKVMKDEGNTPYSSAWENTVALCAIMKDERPQDVLEWMDYHRHIGVDKIYLRENDNSTRLLRYLEPYIKEGFLDYGLKVGTKHPTQTNWFNECGSLAKKKYSWLAFIDIDEFIIVLDKQKSVSTRNALRKTLRRTFRYTGAVSLQWVLFGSGGHIAKPEGGQLASYGRCTGTLSKQMKCVGNLFWTNPGVIFRPFHVHQCTLQPGAPAVLANGFPLHLSSVVVPGHSAPAVSYAGHIQSNMDVHAKVTDEHTLVLFHYVTRSFEEFMNRKMKSRGGTFATEFQGEVANAATQSINDPVLRAKFQEFEKHHEFDRDFPICHQGQPLRDAFKLNYHNTQPRDEPEDDVPIEAAVKLIESWTPPRPSLR